MAGKIRAEGVIIGATLIVAGILLITCSLPVFSYTREELVQTQRTQTILYDSFGLHQLENKTIPVDMSIGQRLDILATGSTDFDFAVTNFTEDGELTSPYLNLTGTSFVNRTGWSPGIRSEEPGRYYLLFQAVNGTADSYVLINANITEIWTDVATVPVVAPDRVRLIDPIFIYVGTGVAVFGLIILRVTFYMGRTPKRAHIPD